jgi:hypothetical protein
MHKQTTTRKALLLKLRVAQPELPCLYITQTLITDRTDRDKGLSSAKYCQALVQKNVQVHKNVQQKYNYEMRHHTTMYKYYNVSEEHSISIFNVEE